MLNHIVIMGRMVNDPELKSTNNGVKYVNIRVACDRDYGDATDFINATAWRGTAEFISKYFQKGKSILLEGRLQIRDWQDRDGNKRREAEIQVESCYFCGGKNSEAPKEEEKPVFEDFDSDEKAPWEDDDELPM